MNLFEQASRDRWRFTGSTNGVMNVEDLWILKLEDLNKIAQRLNKEIKDSGEESFITKRTTVNKTLEGKFELVKHIIGVKLEEKEKKALAIERAEKRAKLIALIGEKEHTELSNKSIEDLKKELASLD